MKDQVQLLAIDDDASFLGELKTALSSDFNVRTAFDVSSAMKSLGISKPDLVLLDMNMPQINGMEFLRVLKQRSPDLPVIMLTGDTSPTKIVSAMQLGADDYVVKSAEDLVPSLRIRISQALTIRKHKAFVSSKVEEAAKKYEILGVSTSTLKLRSDISKFKGTNAFVLILGENGTGKELVARNLNLQEREPTRPFVAVNCAAIPSALFESELFGHVKGSFTGAIGDQIGKFVAANGGDIFLDEIGELPPDMQVKLLRVLQERVVNPVGSLKMINVNVRVIAATNKKLEELVKDGRFRQDLYFRLNQIVLETTPLRERPDDIIYLARLFAKRFVNGITISQSAQKVLESHSWPGNIRELENSIERACLFLRGSGQTQILPEHLTLTDLRPDFGAIQIPQRLLPKTVDDLTPLSYQQCFDWLERAFLEKALELLDGDNNSLIQKLGFSQAGYYRRKKALSLAKSDRIGSI